MDKRYDKRDSRIPGSIAGYIDDEGYRVIEQVFNGELHKVYAHNLRWYMEHKYVPDYPETIMHRDGDRDNNDIKNLYVGTVK